ncbi:hypothetical protein FRC06_005525 [Ceratobasidium sp. 370]|nr:hypothetical protein FRC06_005525 [Ceratobasidium sp. 370]
MKTTRQEELGVPYEIKKYQRTPDMPAPDGLKSVHPLGASPVITDGELVLAEPGAIISKSYPIISSKDKTQQVAPMQTTRSPSTELAGTHYSEGTLEPLLVSRMIYSTVLDRSPLVVRPILRTAFNALLA